MRYRKFAVLGFSVLLAAVAFWIYRDNAWDANMPLTAVITSDGRTEEITCWKDQWNDYCFFIPSYADPSAVHIRANTDDEIWIGDHMLTKEGLFGDQFLMNEAYGMARIGQGNQYDGAIQFIHSENVATMYIDVASGSMEYIHQKKGNSETGTMRLYGVDGELCAEGKVESIKGRGNATWEGNKKPYSLTMSEQTDLLGMGAARRWVLLANRYDTSNLRNKVIYDLAKAAGMAYSPESQWVDLYLNGEYAGLYLLCERNEVHPDRVDITPDNSFLVSRETEVRLVSQNYPSVYMKNGKGYRIHHSSVEPEELEEIWKTIDGAIVARDGIDPETGISWTDLIDLDSWAEKYLIDEVTANHDGGVISQFFYFDGKDPSGKIYAGPVWDMDITLGADFDLTAFPNSFSSRRPDTLYEEDNSPFYRLYQKQEFYLRMVEIYRERFQPLLRELIDSGLDQYAQQIAQASVANEIRWTMGSAMEDKENIRNFLAARVDFLDALWLREEEFCDVMILVPAQEDQYYLNGWLAVRPGEYLPDISAENGDWYVYGSDEPFDITQPIYESVNIYQKQEPVPQPPVSVREEMTALAVLAAILVFVFTADQKRVRGNGMRRTRRPEQRG